MLWKEIQDLAQLQNKHELECHPINITYNGKRSQVNRDEKGCNHRMLRQILEMSFPKLFHLLHETAIV